MIMCSDSSEKSGMNKKPDTIKAKNGPVRERHKKITQLVQMNGFITIDHLAKEFNVTPQTIRRDINVLSEEGIINRYHGGAGAVSSTENVEYNQRKILHLKEKQMIAKMVAENIPNKSSLFINIGTTTEEVAKMLCNHQRLSVITNNLNVATIMSRNEDFEIIVAGGVIRHRDGGIVGPLPIDFIQQFKVDFGIIGISAIDMDGTLFDFDYREVRVSRAIIDNSRKVFLVTDHTKFGRNAMVRLANITEISALFTDRKPPLALTELLAQKDVQLFVAGAE